MPESARNVDGKDQRRSRMQVRCTPAGRWPTSRARARALQPQMASLSLSAGTPLRIVGALQHIPTTLSRHMY